MKKQKKKKKMSKKKIIIILIAILLVICIGFGGYFYYQYKELKKPISKDWGQRYYLYLKDINENGMEEDAALPVDVKDADLSFYEVEDLDDPVMTISYQKGSKVYSNVYYISNDKINVLSYNDPTSIELLYNIEKKKYDYYSHVKEDKTDKYKSISEQIKDRINELNKGKNDNPNVEETAEYSFDEESVDKVVDVNGNELSLTKFDQVFIIPKIKEKSIKYSSNLEERELKEAVSKEVEEYRTIDGQITDKIEKDVEKKITEVEDKKQEIEKAKEVVAKKEAEEKAKKEEEERQRQLREGLKVGSNTLKFGKYTTSVPNGGINGDDLYGTITLSPNGLFHITTNFEQSSGEIRNINEDGTYTTGKCINSFDEQDCIKFRTKGGYSFSYFVTNSTYMNSQWIIYNYSGN